MQAKVRDLVGVNMGWLTREGCHLSMRAKIPDKHRQTARVCRRFFTALVLSDVVDEVPTQIYPSSIVYLPFHTLKYPLHVITRAGLLFHPHHARLGH